MNEIERKNRLKSTDKSSGNEIRHFKTTRNLPT